jgi:hypothetical protein
MYENRMHSRRTIQSPSSPELAGIPERPSSLSGSSACFTASSHQAAGTPHRTGPTVPVASSQQRSTVPSRPYPGLQPQAIGSGEVGTGWCKSALSRSNSPSLTSSPQRFDPPPLKLRIDIFTKASRTRVDRDASQHRKRELWAALIPASSSFNAASSVALAGRFAT